MQFCFPPYRWFLAGSLALLLAGCNTSFPYEGPEEPSLPAVTVTRTALVDLPPPRRRLDVAVYEFEDLTGQYKPSDGYQTLSRAVSQGGGAMLIEALRDTGDGTWFRVVERSNLNNLLQERRVIQEMRQIYLGEETVNPDALPPMLFAGIIIEGGVVGYDTNVITGGAGAALLGIGARTEYRKDTLSVNLRAVSVKTGEVLASVVAQKSLISTSVGANVFRYVDTDAILELEAGLTTNEPSFVALTRTIEESIYALIMEMTGRELWKFKDNETGKRLLQEYLGQNYRVVEQNTLAAVDNTAS